MKASKLTRIMMAVDRETGGLRAACLPETGGVAVLINLDHEENKRCFADHGNRNWIMPLAEATIAAGIMAPTANTELLRQYLGCKE
jgi:hypothetical protein